MRVLFLNQTFYPDVAATAQQASDLAAHLVARGHEVTVVCGRRAYDNAGERYPRHEMWRGVRIRRISSSHFGKKTRARRVADFSSYLANLVIHLSALPRFDVVVALTSPPLISWVGAQFVRMKGGRFVFWVMDLNPDEALAAGWLRPDSSATRRLDAMLMSSLHRATAVVALDRFMKARIEQKGIDPGKIVILPPWSRDDVVHYDEEGRARFRSAHGLDGKFVVMYSGNHSPCHPLTTLLEAGRRLRGRADMAFCFVGGGSRFESVRRYADEHTLANIVTIPYQPLDVLSASLSSADLHVVAMGDPFVGIVHPCKVHNIRTLGIPYLYIGPGVSHIVDLGPAYSARHGEVETVVRHIECAAAASRLRQPNEAAEAGRDVLVARMTHVLEAAVFGSKPAVAAERESAARPEPVDRPSRLALRRSAEASAEAEG